MLQDALTRLGESDDADRAAFEVMRALDGYLEASAPPPAAPSREPPVTDYERRELAQVRWATILVMGGAVLATIIVAVTLSGGWSAGLAIAAVWVVTLLVLLTTG
jgi:ferric-dicitrate binding protein FerR (iron transport regulator)